MDSRMRTPVTIRSRLLIVAVDGYEATGDTILDRGFRAGISEQVATIKTWAAGFSIDDVRPTTRSEAEDKESAIRQLVDSDGALLVYVTGHGATDSNLSHYLLMPDSVTSRLYATAYPTNRLVLAAVFSGARHVVVLVDSCYGGALARQVVADLEAQREACSRRGDGNEGMPQTCAVIASGYRTSTVRLREFTTLITAALRQLGTRRARLQWSCEGPFVSPLAFRWALIEASTQYPEAEWLWVWPDDRATSRDPSPALPNPLQRGNRRKTRSLVADLVLTDKEVQSYWELKASGKTGDDDPGWYFSGRERLMSSVVDYLRAGFHGPHRVLLVTGAAGTGKSAIIARAVTLADRSFRASPQFQRLIRGIPESVMPPIGCIDAAVLARGRSAEEVVERLKHALIEAFPQIDGSMRRQTMSPTERSLDSLVALIQSVSKLIERPVCIVVDGVDESTNAHGLVYDILAPLANRSSVKLILGLRCSPTAEGRQGGSGGLHGLLVSEIDPALVAELRVDTDAAPDIAAYLKALLLNPLPGPTGPYVGCSEAAGRAAEVVSQTEGITFLDARVIGQHMRTASFQQDLGDRRWLESLKEGSIGQLRRDILAVSLGTEVPWEQVLAVMRASAMALGGGIPWEDIWGVAAQAVLGSSFPQVDSVIETVLYSRLSGYMTITIEKGKRLFRPNHERLSEVLRAEPRLLLPGPEDTKWA